MRPMTTVAVAVAMLFALAPSTTAQTPPIEEYTTPTFTQADLFLHRNASPIGNVDAREGRFLTWDATKPTGPAPAVYIGQNFDWINGNHRPEAFLTMKGVTAGDLDKIAFDLYFTGWAQSSIGCGFSLSLLLNIDGEEIVNQDYAGSEGFNFTRVDDTTMRTRFVLTNLWDATKEFGLEYGPEVTHDIYLNIQNFYVCNEVQWQYDSADRPSGLVVNHPSPGAAYFKFNVMDPPPPLTAGSSSLSHQRT